MNTTYLSTADSTHITEQNWQALKIACRKARMHPIQMLKFIAGAAGIPVYRLGRTLLTWKQYQDVMVRLEDYCRRGLASLPPPVGAEDDSPVTEQAWALLQEACRDLGLEQWQSRQVIAEATGIRCEAAAALAKPRIPLDDLDRSRLTERQFVQVFGRLEELEAAQTRPPLSHPPTPLTRPYPQWVDSRLVDKTRKKRTKKSRSAPKDEGIPHWQWDGGFGEE